MAELLAEGNEFKSFAALQDAVHKYEQTCFAQLSRTDSRTIENEEQRRNSKHFNPQIKYSFVTFTCAFGGKPYVSRSTGIRNSKPRIKCNCPVVLKCFASSDGQKLVVRHSQLDCHNHDTSEESFKALPRGRLLDEETEQEIYNLIEMHENKKLARKLIKEKLVEETGRDITYKDIQNIEKRMSRKKEKERNGEDVADSEEMEEEEQRESDQENEGDSEPKMDGDAPVDKDDEVAENGTPEKDSDKKLSDEKKEREDSPTHSPVKSKPKSQGTVKKNPKVTSTPANKIKEEPSRLSTGRPRREIREPRRFRDAVVDKSPPAKKSRVSESGDEESWEDSADDLGSITKEAPSPKKIKKTPGKRGRKPMRRTETENTDDEESEKDALEIKKEQQPNNKNMKDSQAKAEDSSESSSKNKVIELEERRLKMQEEMLELQRQSILLLQNVVQKLERVEENQKEKKET